MTGAAPPPSPRTNLPEPLSNLPEPAVVELGRGHAWITLSELNRLVRQQGIAPVVARAWVLDELVRAIPLEQGIERQLIGSWLAGKGVGNEEELAAWLQRQRLDRQDLVILATQAERLRRFRQHRWGEEVEVEFLRRKPELDQVVYSLIRVSERPLAEELHQRLQEGESSFAELALEHAEGMERRTRGLIGPLPLAHAHPEIAARLRVGQPGQLWAPFAVAKMWVVVRLEELLPARLSEEMRSRMMGDLFEAWLQERVQQLISGRPLPALPPLPAATEEASGP